MATPTILENVPLGAMTTFGVGGKAERLALPESAEEVATLLAFHDVVGVLGGGSNLLVADDGVRGTLVHLGKNFGGVNITIAGDEAIIHAGAAGSFTRLAGIAMKQGIAGLEFAYGIPGRVGGALIMNAGAGGGDVSKALVSATVVTREGDMTKLSKEEIGFGYRTSFFPPGSIIIEAVFRGHRGDREGINQTMRDHQLRRKATQPLEMKSAGSVYKNPPGDYAGRLIEEAGLKGYRVGDAEVSTRHANFIVNHGAATAREVLAVMEHIETTLFDRRGITLEREIRLLGDFSEERR